VFTEERGLNGELLTMKVGHGTESKFFNVAERRRENLDTTRDIKTVDTGDRIHKGNEVRIGDDIVKGDKEIQQDIKKNVYDHVDTHEDGSKRIHHDIDKSITDHGDEYAYGPKITSDTMWSAAIGGNTAPAARISAAQTVAARDQEETAQAESLSKALSEKVSHKGSVSTYTDAHGKGSLTVGTPGEGLLGVGAKAEASVGIGRKNAEESNYNLYYGLIRNAQKDAREKATIDGKFDQARYTQELTTAYHNLAKATDELASGKNAVEFGASAVVGEPAMAAKRMVDKVIK
jgi:hypothetical protein